MLQKPNSKTSGFALIVALSLMAFVLLLILSISTLVQVESESSKGSSATNEAQQNALLALNIAIGELQQLTGPDQRTTALAKLKDNGAGLPTTSTTTEQPNWVGVWGNSSVANYSQSPSAIVPSKPVLLNWLVSGNESVDHIANIKSDEFGQIQTAPNESSIAYKPTDAITALENATAFTPLTVKGKDAQLMVGRYSTIPNATENTVVTPEQAKKKFVAAPLVEIGSTQGTTGRYAWWVADEGAKAKVNVRPSYLDQDQDDSKIQAEYQNFSFMTAQRAALEFVDYDDSGNRLDTEFDFTNPKLERVKDLATLPFLDSDNSDNSDNSTPFESVIAERFHEITTHSYGVLADAYAGGLKKDLTADFGGSSLGPSDNTPIFKPLKSSDNVPTWGQARSLINPSISGNVGNYSTDPILPSDTTNGVYPVFTAASLGVDFYLSDPIINPVNNNIAYYELRVALVPLVVLWNPHTVAINASTYELGMRVHHEGISQTRLWIDVDGVQQDVLDLNSGIWNSQTQNGDQYLRFALKTSDLAPGESHIYSLDVNASPYNSGVSRLSINPPTVNNYLNHVIPTNSNLQIGPAKVISRRGRITYEPPDINVEAFVQRANLNSPQFFDVVLAKPGGISNLSNQTDWYHAVLDAKLGIRANSASDSRSPTGTVSIIMEKGTNGSYTNLNQLVGSNGPSGLNINAFRIYNVMERRGGIAGVGGNRMGSLSFSNQHNSGRKRWLMTGNPRARFVKNTEVENKKNTRGSVVFSSNFDNYSQPIIGGARLFPHVSGGNGNRLTIGRVMDDNPANYGVAPLFDQLDSTEKFLSLGQLQHSITGAYGFNQSYPFGNSLADVRIDRELTYIPNKVTPPHGAIGSETLYDLSWYANRAVWDKYFVSTVPDNWSQTDITDLRTLPNSRMSYYGAPELNSIQGNVAYDEAASNLWVDGAFNINSTSEQAWRSLLSATFGIPDSGNGNFADSGDNVSQIIPIPRFATNQSQTGYNGANFSNTMQSRIDKGTSLTYIGNRGLKMSYDGTPNGDVKDLVNELARTIVNEVKLRGPFLSLGDFVNRALVKEDYNDPVNTRQADWGVDPATDIGITGALQAAIDKMGLDEDGNYIPGRSMINSINDGSTGSSSWHSRYGVKDADDAWYMMEEEWNFEHYLGGPNRGVNNGAKMPQSISSAGSPSFMTAADLLTVIGPAISARTDTFRIRTYGETVNPITQQTEGRAWCEAIVQRLPNYIDGNEKPDVEPVSLSSTANIQFGRKYKILSLRWLDATEI